MWFATTGIFFFLIYLSGCDNSSPDDTTGAILEAAKTLFNDEETLQNVGKQVGEMFSDKANGVESVNSILSGIGNFMTGGKNRHGIDLAMVSSMLETILPSQNSRSKRHPRGEEEVEPPAGFDLETLISFGNLVAGKEGNPDALMGLIPVLMNNFFGSGGGGGNEEGGGTGTKKHDHSGHSWYMPPILEHIHVMWEHFSNSELGQTLWKNSGLANIVGQMTDKDGNIQYTQILDSFENPMLRRRWIKSLTNFVAEWVSRISDPATQQRYLSTGQFVINSFLKAQGLPKAAMLDSTKPAESITRLCNIVAAKHLGVKMDCSQYVKPAVSYVQELMNLASDKGFIMSRINAMELSNKLSDTINNDLVGPVLKAYRAYKWSVKVPSCATQILCTINERRKDESDDSVPEIRRILTKISSFPAAYYISSNTSLNFWNLYAAIVENAVCMDKYPEDCKAFHEEELRVTTTEYVHSEL